MDPPGQYGVCLPGVAPLLESIHRGHDIAVGDWNGDSRADVLFGSVFGGQWKENSSGQETTGSVSLHVAESTTGQWGGPYDDLDAQVLIFSEEIGDNFGWAVEFIGDLDCDGHEDFVVGAPRGPLVDPPIGDDFFTYTGSVYVFLAKHLDPDLAYADECATTANPVPGGHYVSQVASLRILPWNSAPDAPGPPGSGDFAELGSAFGFTLCNVGDIDGDGYPDLAVGAPGPEERDKNFDPDPNSFSGRVYLLSGKKIADAANFQEDSATSCTDPPDVAPSVSPVPQIGAELLLVPRWDLDDGLGLHPGSRFGYAISGKCDVDGDGHTDFAVGDPHHLYRGIGVFLEPRSTECFGTGSVRVFHGWDGSDPLLTAGQVPTSIQIDGISFFDETMFPPPSPTDPFINESFVSYSYGEGFGLSVATAPQGTSGPQTSWEVAVGSPLFSFQNMDEDGHPLFSIQDIDAHPVAEYFMYGPEFFEPDLGAIAGRLSCWVFGTQAQSTATMTYSHRGSYERGELGWNVDAAGDLDGNGSQDLAVCSKGVSIGSIGEGRCDAPVFQSSVDLSPCNVFAPPRGDFPPGPLDNDAGGVVCGLLEVLDGQTFSAIRRIAGEDDKDSTGWAYKSMPDLDGDGKPEMLFSSPRWPGKGGLAWQSTQGSTSIYVQPFKELDESGRIYLWRSSHPFDPPSSN